MGRPGRGESKLSPRRIDVALRRAEAIKLRIAGMSMKTIADRLGYCSDIAAYNDIKRALAAATTEPVEEMRQIELARLDVLWQKAMMVLARQHLSVSNGRVVHLDGTPVPDDAPVLQAIDRLLKIQERRARLLGLDAPRQVEVVTIDAVEAEIKRLNAELAAVDAATADVERDETGEAVGAETAPQRS